MGDPYRDLEEWRRKVATALSDLQRSLDRLLAETERLLPMEVPAKVRPEPDIARRNCWTCRHNRVFDPPPIEFECSSLIHVDDRCEWASAQDMDEYTMPPETADGCPGWEAEEQS